MAYATRLTRALGANVKRLRSNQGLSKASLAQMSDMSRPTLYKIERGQFDATLSVLQQLADALCVEPADLLSSQCNGSGANRLDSWL